jgi:hypothetical protein
MNNRFLRRIALSLIGLLIFAQANVTLAYCPMDRGMLSLTVGAAEEDPCSDCGDSVSAFGSLYANRCVTHCTADLQLAGLPLALVRAPAHTPVLVVERPTLLFGLPAFHAPPSGDPPRRVLLHSYQV